MKPFKLSITAAAIALATVPFAAAVPTIYFDLGDDGTLDGTIVDQGGGDLALGSPGILAGVFAGGGLVDIVAASTKPVVGDASNPQMSSTNLRFDGPGTLAIYFTEDGFGPTGQDFQAQLSDTSLAPGATIDYYSYATVAPFGGVFAGPGAPFMTLSLNSAPAGTGTSGVLPFDGSTSFPYTLTQKVVITSPGAGITNTTAVLAIAPTAVPDNGTTLVLLGASLLGVAAIRRFAFGNSPEKVC